MTSVPYGDRWIHAYTHSDHPACCAVGPRKLEILEKAENAAKMRGEALGRITTLSNLKPVGEVHGTGLMVTVELVVDGRTKVGSIRRRKSVRACFRSGCDPKERRFGGSGRPAFRRSGD